MAFAMFYDATDLAMMAAQFNDSRLSGPDRNAGRTFWNNGLSGWQTAPRAPVEHPDYDAIPGLVMVVIQNNTLAAFRQYLYSLADGKDNQGRLKYPGLEFLAAIADDLGTVARYSVVEPWPWIALPDEPSPWTNYPRNPPPSG